MRQCSRREYHKPVMKRQNEMRKQRVAVSFIGSNKNHFGKKFLRLEGEPLG